MPTQRPRRGRSTFECARCSRFIPAGELLVVTAKTSREQLALHRSCLPKLIATMKAPSARAVRREIVKQGAAR